MTEARIPTRSPSRLIFIFIFSFVFATAISSVVFIQSLIAVLLLSVGMAIILADKVGNKRVSQEVIFIFIFLVAFSFGSLRYSIKDFHQSRTPLMTGVVIEEPEDKDNFRRFVLLSDNGEKVLVQAPLYSPVQYGDRVIVEGELEVPGLIEGEDNGISFDYGKYLAKDDIYHILNFADVEIVSSGNGNKIKSILFKLKKNFVGHIKDILSEPFASLLAGLIVAGRDAMPKDILEEFRRAGVVHIVVLSGFNITLIAEFMRKLFRSNWVAVIGIFLFVLMTGAEATVVRASIMALIVILARVFGRNYSAPRALLLGGFLMLLQNPKILVFDPSFQLSFLATLGLIYLCPPIERGLRFVSQKWKLRETLAQTVATQLTVLPLLIYSIGDISLVSLPANLLILLIIPFTMLVGFVATILSYVSAALAWPLAFISHLLLSWILLVSSFFGNLSFATISIPPVSILVVIMVYVVSLLLIHSGLAGFKMICIKVRK